LRPWINMYRQLVAKDATGLSAFGHSPGIDAQLIRACLLSHLPSGLVTLNLRLRWNLLLQKRK